MRETIDKLEELLKNGLDYCSKTSELEINQKSSPEKWSKKEILGHLVDSGINNLQRFTEIQFEEKPFIIRKYNQDELVKANDYQNADFKEIVNFWLSINIRILNIIKKQTDEKLDYTIELDEENEFDFKFLIKDYVAHLEYHLNQIIN